MRILVIGSGGREHALVWKIAQSRLCTKLFCAPGNGGISQLAECLEIKTDNIAGLLEFSRKEKIDLTVVGPEQPLALGLVDEFKRAGLMIFGPQKSAANLEASKIFSKQLMAKYKVPTAKFKVFDSPLVAKQYIETQNFPCVVKADGLAAGKGVVVAENLGQAQAAVRAFMQDKVFGVAGQRIIIEECLVGQEASILVVTDSKKVLALASAQDHKRIFDNDQGANTGGMGAYSPASIVSAEIFKAVMDRIIYPILAGLGQEGIDYRGVLYAGVMLTKEGPQALEFNVRFGDPETQVILPRLKTDLVELLMAASSGQLSKIGDLEWDSRACVCVVCAAGGYPGSYSLGQPISGLDRVAKSNEVLVFHAGTQIKKDKIVTSGGRVLGVTGLGITMQEAVKKTYQAVEKINFSGMHYRRDIGRKAIADE